MFELLDIIDTSERFQFISNIISHGDSFVLQSIAEIINMIELGYGRLAANGEEQGYKKILTLEELIQLETIFTSKVKQILNEFNLFDFNKWEVVCYLLECFDHNFIKMYLEKTLKENVNIAKYITGSVGIWTGSGIQYEIRDTYKKYLTDERVLQAIKTLKESGELFLMSETIQNKCGAFYLNATTDKKNYHGNVMQTDVNKLLDSWRI